MRKTILITGATDGIGLETAKRLLPLGHKLLLHGRSEEKLGDVTAMLASPGQVETYRADFSDLLDVEAMANAIAEKHSQLDVIINNAGVLKIANPVTNKGLDARFVVNTFAPYILTKRLMSFLGNAGRVVNVSSAAQSPVDLELLKGNVRAGGDDLATYAQSKLAITMWTRQLASRLGSDGPMIVAVNPGSLLGSKMVKEGFGMDGKDLGIGADILIRAALSEEFEKASGMYFDNDSGQFADPHPDALNPQKCEAVVAAIEETCEP